MTFEIGADTIEGRAGDFVFGPRDVPHRYTVGEAGARMLFVLTPGGSRTWSAPRDPAASRTLPPPDHPMPDEGQMRAAQRSAGCAVLE